MLSTKSIKLFLLIGLLADTLGAQPENFWHTLAQVRFETKKDKAGYTIEVPVFSQYLKTFQGKPITLKGYIIPVEELGGGGKFMLSAVPFNLCFFCGAAGPETVIEVETKQSVKFTTKTIVMKGVLWLNDSNPNHHIFVLKDAKLED